MENFNNSDRKTWGLSLGVFKEPSRHGELVLASPSYQGIAGQARNDGGGMAIAGQARNDGGGMRIAGQARNDGRVRNDRIVFIPLFVFAFFIAHIFATLLAADVPTSLPAAPTPLHPPTSFTTSPYPLQRGNWGTGVINLPHTGGTEGGFPLFLPCEEEHALSRGLVWRNPDSVACLWIASQACNDGFLDMAESLIINSVGHRPTNRVAPLPQAVSLSINYSIQNGFLLAGEDACAPKNGLFFTL